MLAVLYIYHCIPSIGNTHISAKSGLRRATKHPHWTMRADRNGWPFALRIRLVMSNVQAFERNRWTNYPIAPTHVVTCVERWTADVRGFESRVSDFKSPWAIYCISYQWAVDTWTRPCCSKPFNCGHGDLFWLFSFLVVLCSPDMSRIQTDLWIMARWRCSSWVQNPLTRSEDESLPFGANWSGVIVVWAVEYFGRSDHVFSINWQLLYI